MLIIFNKINKKCKRKNVWNEHNFIFFISFCARDTNERSLNQSGQQQTPEPNVSTPYKSETSPRLLRRHTWQLLSKGQMMGTGALCWLSHGRGWPFPSWRWRNPEGANEGVSNVGSAMRTWLNVIILSPPIWSHLPPCYFWAVPGVLVNKLQLLLLCSIALAMMCFPFLTIHKLQPR